MKAGLLSIAAAVLILAACQSSPPSTEQSAGQQRIEQADLRNAQAFCAMIDVANRQTAARGKPLPDNEDCVYFRQNGTLVGYSAPRRNQYTGFFANMRDISAYGRAQNAKLPTSVSDDRDASELYRKLLTRGFDEGTAATVSRSSAFSAAVSAFRQARQARGMT